MAERAWDTSTFAGLNAFLENRRTTVEKACLAVEDCISCNRYNYRSVSWKVVKALYFRLIIHVVQG
jgi:hypothetical protein